MSSRPNGRSSNDWVLYAFIISHKGGSLSLEELSTILGNFKRRDGNRRRIAAIIKANKKQGFERSLVYSDGSYLSIYEYNGEPLSINRSTMISWTNILNN